MNNNLLQYVVVVVALAAILGGCGGRELRPSDHGLEFQESSPPPAQNGDVQEMRSFFGATATASSSSSPVELPEAKNISDTWLGGGRARDGGRDHVRLGLLAASAVCGLTGVVLLAISGIVFLFRLPKRGPRTERISSTSALNYLADSNAEMKSSG